MKDRILARRNAFVAALVACHAKSTPDAGVPLPPPSEAAPIESSPAPSFTGTARACLSIDPSALGDVKIGPIASSVPNAERVVGQLKAGFRSCYMKARATDPNMKGTIVLAAKLQPNGDVADVSKVSGSGLSSEVEDCVIRRLKNASFDAPGGTGATVTVPLSFE